MAEVNAYDATLALLARRASDATVCPSEVARSLAVAGDAGSANRDWRDLMPAVHEAVDRLLAAGHVRLTWKARILPLRTGPYRIGRGARDTV